MKSVTSASSAAPAQRGFTLIEIMITVAIVAILAAIALPAYNSYILKSEMRTAQADLLALSLGFENYYQRTLVYPELAGSNGDTTAKIKEKMTSWNPGDESNFNFKMDASTTTTYTITAEGKSGTRHENCKISLSHVNERRTTGCQFTSGGNWL